MMKEVRIFARNCSFLLFSAVIAGFSKALALSVLCLMTALPIHAAIETVNETTVKVETLGDLETALKDASIETIIVKKCITLENGTVLDGQTTGTKNKTIQVEVPFCLKTDVCASV